MLSLVPYLYKIATYSAVMGDTVTFWNDLWGLGMIKWRFPQLSPFAKKKNASVLKFWSVDIHDNF